jgi:hypothetical protein
VAWLTDTIDAVESWIVGQSFWVQIAILLGTLLPLCWVVAGLIDRVVEWLLRNHTRRERALLPPPGGWSQAAPNSGRR